MIRCVWLRGSEDLEAALSIREDVFCREQGFSRELERDEWDAKSLHLLVYEDDEPIATGRLLMKDDRLHVGRVAVRKEKRGQGVGDLVMRVLLDMALRMGAEEVAIGAQIPVIPFYERYGFTEQGERYEEEGCPHAHLVAKSEALEANLYGGCSGCGCGCGDCVGCSGGGDDAEEQGLYDASVDVTPSEV